MSTYYSRLSLRAFILLISSLGCTETIPVSVKVSMDTNWSPSIHISGNNYQRVSIYWENPPLEIRRNIAGYNILRRLESESEFTVFDSTQGYYSRYGSSPVFEQDRQYVIKVVVRYFTGELRPSQELSIHTPVVRGKINREIDGWFATLLYRSTWSYSSGTIYVGDYLDRKLYSINAVTGQATILRDSFPNRFTYSGIEAMTASEQGVLITLGPPYSSDTSGVFLLSTDDSSLKWLFTLKHPPGWGRTIYPEYYTAHDGRSFWVLYQYYLEKEGIQLFRYDATTGSLEKEFPVDRRFVEVAGFVVASGAVWVNSTSSFDNRIYKLSSDALEVLEVHRNPAFRSTGLSREGPEFWTSDYAGKKFVQFLVDGL